MIGVHSKSYHHPLLDEAVVEEEAKPPEDEGALRRCGCVAGRWKAGKC